LFLVFRLIEDPPGLSCLKGAGVRVDYTGIALLVLGVGALQVMLDKGQEDDWFRSHFILTLALISGACLLSLAIWEWFRMAAGDETVVRVILGLAKGFERTVPDRKLLM
jgi:MFS transporter, DHA2 family, multidrug resistance protein